ncbi:endo-1,4-beta-xylanase [Ginsengibacter hankyongi]|uniref:Beta-xylanase n=1 Tax=Ginsengibacter hankyongi TaxID=2607284 RepID=A0A5J5IFM7_9BACT|nr:endo-1,4-beta-xylanase [Ginsengibacter hankyongi]
MLNLYFAVLILSIISCSKKNHAVTPGNNTQNPPPAVVSAPLKDKALFEIGAAVTVAHLKEPDFANTFKTNFNQLSAEYEMKMKQIWTSATTYSFDGPDYLVNFAAQNSMKVHGHTLLWYKSFPDWFINAAYDSLNFENNVKAYIQTVVGRYKGKIRSWDVANEIFADDGSLRIDASVYKTFKDPIGFYERCFQYARDTDPDAKLFYNDYDQVLNSAKRSSLKKMVERFRKEGYPIDGIGDQFHTTVWTDKATINIGLTDLASTGLLIHISELDIRVNQNKSDSYVFTDAEQQKQANMYKAIVEMYEALPQAQKFAITVWGITDKYSWLLSWWSPKEYPLLFNGDYSKKKAYEGFLSGLK